MATAPSHHDLLHLLPLTQFLTLAPATSASYPTHRRTESSESTSTTVTQASSAQDEVAPAGTIPAAENIVTVSPVVAELEKKTRRSSSLSSTGSSRTASGQFRFLRLGPVHHGAHIEGDDDWSEEVAVSE